MELVLVLRNDAKVRDSIRRMELKLVDETQVSSPSVRLISPTRYYHTVEILLRKIRSISHGAVILNVFGASQTEQQSEGRRAPSSP